MTSHAQSGGWQCWATIPGDSQKLPQVFRVWWNETKKDNCLSSSAELDLIVGDSLDLGSRGRLGVEAVVEPVGSELLGQLDTNDTLTHA